LTWVHLVRQNLTNTKLKALKTPNSDPRQIRNNANLEPTPDSDQHQTLTNSRL